MARRGRKRQLDVESRYWQLLLSGTGTVQACQLVGITRKTGIGGGRRTQQPARRVVPMSGVDARA